MKKKKSSTKMPKPRHAWKINPKTRVKDSTKTYSRRKTKKVEKDWVDEIFA